MTVKERTSAREKVIEASKKYSTKLRSRLYRDTLKGSKAPDMDKDRQPASGSKATRRELSDAVNQAIKHFSGKEIYANQLAEYILSIRTWYAKSAKRPNIGWGFSGGNKKPVNTWIDEVWALYNVETQRQASYSWPRITR